MQDTVHVPLNDRMAVHYAYDMGYRAGHEDEKEGKKAAEGEYPGGLLDAPESPGTGKNHDRDE